MLPEITPEILLRAYSVGLFPMSEGADDPGLFWVDPDRRAIIPLDGFHLPRRLARTIRQERFEVRTDTDFEQVIGLCAAERTSQGETWINDRIRAMYGELFRLGHVHTVECWLGEQLVGGLYGVSLGGGFFGESMFHRATDASKVALAHLVARLRLGGYALLDTQFQTTHLAQFGTTEISRRRYKALLAQAIAGPPGDWARAGQGLRGAEVIRAILGDEPPAVEAPNA